MTDLICTYRPLPPLSPADKIYIRSNFHTLEELCLSRPDKPADCRSQIRARLLPLPTYAIERMAESYGQQSPEVQIGEEFASYLSGEYRVCLRWVTPETIFLKGLAMGKIDELLSEPNAGDSEWSAALRSWVNRLDAMEREFAPCDTARFGSLPSRVRYIANARAKYSACLSFGCFGMHKDEQPGHQSQKIDHITQEAEELEDRRQQDPIRPMRVGLEAEPGGTGMKRD
jgi:Family of unknown function (DUF6058)